MWSSRACTGSSPWPNAQLLVLSANGPCQGASLLARYLFTRELQGTSLPHINMEQNRCCWDATPLRTICLDVFVRMETLINGAGIVPQATLYIWAASHKLTQHQQESTMNCGRNTWLHPEGPPCQPLLLNDLEAELFEYEIGYWILIAELKHKF